MFEFDFKDLILQDDEYLEFLKTKKLSENTSKVYLRRLKYYIYNKNENDKLINKDKRYINQMKQALLYFLNMNDVYYAKELIELRKIHNISKIRNKKPEKTLYLKKINQKINLLPSSELRKKLAFRLIEISGLRISEISNLEKNDIEFADNNRLIVTVRHGKGNKRRVIKTIKDKYVWEKLKNLEPRKGEKIFHSTVTLMKKAQELGFKTHRLRKVFADQIYFKFNGTEKERIDLLGRALGHEKNKIYKRYVDTNINYIGTRFDI